MHKQIAQQIEHRANFHEQVHAIILVKLGYQEVASQSSQKASHVRRELRLAHTSALCDYVLVA